MKIKNFLCFATLILYMMLLINDAFATECVVTSRCHLRNGDLVTCEEDCGTSKYQYEYDSQGNFQKRNEWTYSTSGESTGFNQYTYNNGWIKTHASIWMFNSEGDPIDESCYVCSNGNCLKDSEYKYEYDSYGGKTESYYECENGICSKTQITSESYDQYGNQTDYSEYNCHNGICQRTVQQIYDIDYNINSDGVQTSYRGYECGDSICTKQTEAIATYDDNGNRISEEWYTCISEICTKDRVDTYTYDENGRETNYSYYECSNGLCTKRHEYDYKNGFQYNYCARDTCSEPSNISADKNHIGTVDADKYSPASFSADTFVADTVPINDYCPEGCNSCDENRSCNQCAANYRQIETWCNRIRYTPAEAAAVMNDDDNTIVLTFKK